MGSQQSEKDHEGPTGPTTQKQTREAITRGQAASGSICVVALLFAGTSHVRWQRYRTVSSGLLFSRRSASAEEGPGSGGDAATLPRVGAEGGGSLGAGRASKRSIRSTSASAGRKRVVLSSRSLSLVRKLRRNS